MSDLAVLKMLERAGADFNHTSPDGRSVFTFPLLNMNSDFDKMESVMEYLLAKTNIGEEVAFDILITYIM